MSGGSLNYFYSEMESHIGDFDDPELDDLVRDLAKLFHDREWYLSSDTSEGSWRDARDAFKQKWFKDGARQERVEKYLKDIRREVLDSFGLSKEYCRFCAYWTREKGGSEYGSCDYEQHCLMHQGERCERFAEA